MTFRPANLCEDMGGLYWEPKYQVWRWTKGRIYASLTREEDAIFCHFSAAPSSVRDMKEAVNDFCALAFELLPWCTMIMGCIKRDSVVRLVKKCGFVHVIDHKDLKIYVRYRK
nr:hypothetical protein [uncultured Pseudomonas sp.]